MIKDLAKKSRSWRGYDESRRFTREELLEFVDCARYAPTTINHQPLKYVIAYKKETVDKIQPYTYWARSLPEAHLPHPGKCPTAFIVICQETEWKEDITRYEKDVGAVAQTMLLAATEMGLGGIMINNFHAQKISEVLELPAHLAPLLIVAFGKPDETIVLEEVDLGADLKYYRDENDVHHVPKRKLKDVVIEK